MIKDGREEKVMPNEKSFFAADQPRLLLHVCCGPDATAVIERLQPHYRLAAVFYNPNIFPPEEYTKRLDTAAQVMRHYGIPLLETPYANALWEAGIAGLEREPERGERCRKCFEHNLEYTARRAQAEDYEFFSTTLTISPHKSSKLIFQIGQALAARFGVQFLAEDFKKKEGFKRSLEQSRELKLYRQADCGCRYSKGEY
jgi:hypothetical protein